MRRNIAPKIFQTDDLSCARVASAAAWERRSSTARRSPRACARGRARRSQRSRPSTGAARAGHGARRRRPGARGLRRRQAEGHRGGRHRRLRPPAARRRLARRGRRADREAQRRRRGQRHPLQLPVPGHLDGVELTGLVDARQGRRRPHADQRRPARPRPRGAAARARRRASWTCSPRSTPSCEGAEAVVDRPLEPVRQADGPAAAGANATVTICHSRTHDLPAVARRADVLIAAVGRAEMVRGDWVKPGAVVIDVGMNRTDDGLKGDVAFAEASEVAARDHAGPRRRRADDHRLPAAQHAAGRADGRAVTLGKLRSGDVLAGLGGLALLVAHVLPGSTCHRGRLLGPAHHHARYTDRRRWRPSVRSSSCWSSSRCCGIAQFVTTAFERTSALPVAAQVFAASSAPRDALGARAADRPARAELRAPTCCGARRSARRACWRCRDAVAVDARDCAP